MNKAKTPTPSAEPVISQPPALLLPSQKVIIGKTTTTDIEKNYRVKQKQSLSNNELKYSIDSNIEARSDQIIFQNNLAKFERIVVVGNSNSGNIKISTQILKYGPPEKILNGSNFYGYQMDTYIYPAKGFAFIANKNTDEIYEIQTFAPTSLDNYLSNYGDDISGPKEIKEGI